MSEQDFVSKNKLKLLVEGKLPLDDIHALLRMPVKDADRFWKYLEILQERVSWKEKILVRISEHLYVVQKGDERIVKCDCGQEFGDYRVNWKLSSLVYARTTKEAFDEIFTTQNKPNPEIVEIREFYCPGCSAQLGVESVPAGYPFLFEVLPDIDTLYEWEGKPLASANKQWYQDLTATQTEKWAKESSK
ncbi:MAG: acetone carboxylase subunit gamma [Sterolibacterium sp.]